MHPYSINYSVESHGMRDYLREKLIIGATRQRYGHGAVIIGGILSHTVIFQIRVINSLEFPLICLFTRTKKI